MPLSSVRRAVGRLTTLAALGALCGAAAACSDDPNKPSGPVAIRFITVPYYNDPDPTPADSARPTALVSVDNGPTITVRTGDSITNVARGEHTFRVQYD